MVSRRSFVRRRLPAALIDVMVAKVAALSDPDAGRHTDPWELDVEVVPTSMVTDVVGPNGRVPMGPPAIVPECPMGLELLKPGPM